MRKRKYVPDIIALGAQYEGNYTRLMKLTRMMGDDDFGDIALNVAERFVGVVTIRLLEACKYTDTLLLEQTSAAGKWLNNPSMTVRMYHDATVAEVISSRGHTRIEGVNSYPNQFMHHPDEKIQLNMFLSEWLGFCLAYGCCDKSPFKTLKM